MEMEPVDNNDGIIRNGVKKHPSPGAGSDHPNKRPRVDSTQSDSVTTDEFDVDLDDDDFEDDFDGDVDLGVVHNADIASGNGHEIDSVDVDTESPTNPSTGGVLSQRLAETIEASRKVHEDNAPTNLNADKIAEMALATVAKSHCTDVSTKVAIVSAFDRSGGGIDHWANASDVQAAVKETERIGPHELYLLASKTKNGCFGTRSQFTKLLVKTDGGGICRCCNVVGYAELDCRTGLAVCERPECFRNSREIDRNLGFVPAFGRPIEQSQSMPARVDVDGGVGLGELRKPYAVPLVNVNDLATLKQQCWLESEDESNTPRRKQYLSTEETIMKTKMDVVTILKEIEDVKWSRLESSTTSSPYVLVNRIFECFPVPMANNHKRALQPCSAFIDSLVGQYLDAPSRRLDDHARRRVAEKVAFFLTKAVKHSWIEFDFLDADGDPFDSVLKTTLKRLYPDGTILCSPFLQYVYARSWQSESALGSTKLQNIRLIISFHPQRICSDLIKHFEKYFVEKQQEISAEWMACVKMSLLPDFHYHAQGGIERIIAFSVDEIKSLKDRFKELTKCFDGWDGRSDIFSSFSQLAQWTARFNVLKGRWDRDRSNKPLTHLDETKLYLACCPADSATEGWDKLPIEHYLGRFEEPSGSVDCDVVTALENLFKPCFVTIDRTSCSKKDILEALLRQRKKLYKAVPTSSKKSLDSSDDDVKKPPKSHWDSQLVTLLAINRTGDEVLKWINELGPRLKSRFNVFTKGHSHDSTAFRNMCLITRLLVVLIGMCRTWQTSRSKKSKMVSISFFALQPYFIPSYGETRQRCQSVSLKNPLAATLLNYYLHNTSRSTLKGASKDAASQADFFIRMALEIFWQIKSFMDNGWEDLNFMLGTPPSPKPTGFEAIATQLKEHLSKFNRYEILHSHVAPYLEANTRAEKLSQLCCCEPATMLEAAVRVVETRNSQYLGKLNDPSKKEKFRYMIQSMIATGVTPTESMTELSRKGLFRGQPHVSFALMRCGAVDIIESTLVATRWVPEMFDRALDLSNHSQEFLKSQELERIFFSALAMNIVVHDLSAAEYRSMVKWYGEMSPAREPTVCPLCETSMLREIEGRSTKYYNCPCRAFQATVGVSKRQMAVMACVVAMKDQTKTKTWNQVQGEVEEKVVEKKFWIPF